MAVAGEMGGGEEVASGLIVVRSDGAELIEFGEEIFNEMPGLMMSAYFETLLRLDSS